MVARCRAGPDRPISSKHSPSNTLR